MAVIDVDHIGIHGRDFKFLVGDAVRAKEEQFVAGRGDLEIGMEGFTGGVFVFIRGEDENVFARCNGHVGEDEQDFVLPVAETVTADVDRLRARIGQFNPVRERTGFIRIGPPVAGHDLINAELGIPVSGVFRRDLRAGNVFRRLDGGGRDKQDQDHQKRDQNQNIEQCKFGRLDAANHPRFPGCLRRVPFPFILHA